MSSIQLASEYSKSSSRFAPEQMVEGCIDHNYADLLNTMDEWLCEMGIKGKIPIKNRDPAVNTRSFYTNYFTFIEDEVNIMNRLWMQSKYFM